MMLPQKKSHRLFHKSVGFMFLIEDHADALREHIGCEHSFAHSDEITHLIGMESVSLPTSVMLIMRK